MINAGGTPIQIACDSCGNPVSVADINMELGVAKCVPCDSLFPIATQVAMAQKPAPLLTAPRSIRVEDAGYEMRLSRKWFTPLAFFLIFFSLFWNTIVSIFVGVVVNSFVQGKPEFLLAVFMLPFVAIGASVAYVSIAMLINKTVIVVNGTQLHSSHGPLKFGRAVSLDVPDIEQIYVTKETGNNGHESYKLFARVSNDEDREISAYMHDYKAARFIEQEIERFLGLPDLPVAGEATG